jgi:SP family arabinose:H+ symporter-like MFS transporter
MICPVYVAELAPAVWRGRFGSLFQFGIVSGIFLTLFINAKIQAFGGANWNVAKGWRWMLGAEVLPAMLLLILLFFVKESPRWLVQMGREGEARDTLEKIHGPQEAEAEIAATKEVLKQSEAGFFELLSNARFRKLLVIAVLLMAFSQFSGINAIMYYSTKIFLQAGVGVKDSFMASTVVGLVNLLFTLVAVALVDKAGRRILLLVGLVAQVIALGAVGWMFKTNVSGMPLLVAILAFIGAFAMALGPIPWILCSEIFPTRVRGRAMSVATFTIWTACYIVAQTFPMLNDSKAVGPALTFWIYAACSLAALIFVFFMVPETKGRSLEEIEASFAGESRA